jgi:hypothetical protein
MRTEENQTIETEKENPKLSTSRARGRKTLPHKVAEIRLRGKDEKSPG